MNGIADVDFYWGNGNNESQYGHGFPFPSSGGWGLRRNYTWYFYNMSVTYNYGLGDTENGYFLGEYAGNGNYTLAVLRGNTLYYDTNWDSQHDGTFSFGTGLK
ncbi:MAG: hypothetical protein KGZ42_12830 [Melioribacter sp.]|nr:hypothetical protein [Melioribacter sp.]